MNTILAAEKAFALANVLDEEGLFEIAEEIRTSIYGGATGLEIAFRLREKLKSLQREEKIPMSLITKVIEIEQSLK